MNLKIQTFTLACLLALLAPPARAQDDHDHDHDHGGDVHAGDIELEVDSHDGESHIHVHGGPVFTGELGLDAAGSTFAVTDDPGFDSEPGTFPLGSEVGFDLLQPLRRWDGDGFVNEALYALRLAFDDGITEHEAETGAGPITGFALPVAGDGSFHEHLTFSLRDGAGDIPALPDAQGVYLLEMRMWSDLPSIEPSDPLWIVFNFGESEAVHDAATDHVQTVLVPEPTAAALLACLAAGTLMRRRR